MLGPEEASNLKVPDNAPSSSRRSNLLLPENRERLTWLRSVHNGYSRWDPLDEDEVKVMFLSKCLLVADAVMKGEQEDESAKVENTQIFLDALQMKPDDIDILFNFAQYLTRSGKGADVG